MPDRISVKTKNKFIEENFGPFTLARSRRPMVRVSLHLSLSLSPAPFFERLQSAEPRARIRDSLRVRATAYRSSRVAESPFAHRHFGPRLLTRLAGSRRLNAFDRLLK